MPSQATSEMPRYKCHKEVHALKIIGISEDRSTLYHGRDFAPIDVEPAWVAKHDPQVGGYLVVYEDGYTSYSPAEAFEAGYTLIS
ncbi:MAG: hypothetical protein V3W32_05790 [Gemmatimonadota bacterium]